MRFIFLRSAMTALISSLLIAAVWHRVHAAPDDPYAKTFDDFEWTADDVRVPIPGAVPLGVRVPLTQSIAHFEQRVKDRPGDWMSMTFLGNLYFLHAKETDSWDAYAQAVETLEESLKLQPNHKATKLYLAETLAAQHRFSEALDLATDVSQADPNSDFAIAIKSDCELELGQYDKAKESLDRLFQLESSAPVLARKAGYAELTGHPADAIALIDEALKDLDEMGATPEETQWYYWRKAGLHFGEGDLKAADEYYKKSLAIDPGDPASLTGLAEVQFAHRDVEAAIDSITKVIDAFEAPPAMALLGDIYAATGRSELAETWYAKAELAMRQEQITAGEAHARELAMFLADHNRHTEEAVSLARADLGRRQDVMAFDALAWCLLANDEPQQALAYINKALAIGIKNASVFYHAARIHEANGKPTEASEYDQLAKKKNPYFSVLFSSRLSRETQ